MTTPEIGPEVRLGTHYQSRLGEWEARYGGETAEVRAELERDWSQILHLRQWSADHAGDNDAAAILCSQLAGVAGQIMEDRLSRHEQIIWREDGLRAVDHLLKQRELPEATLRKLERDRLAHLSILTFAHLMNRNAERAQTLGEQTLALSRELAVGEVEEATLVHLAGISLQSDPARAIPMLEQALELMESRGDSAGKATALDTLGTAFSRIGEHERAVSCHEESIDLYRQKGHRSGLATALVNQASALMPLERWSRAEAQLNKAKEIAEDLGAQGIRGLVLANLGKLHACVNGTGSQIFEEWEAALTAFRQAGDSIQASQMLRGLLGLYESALGSEDLTNTQRAHALRRLARIHSELDQGNLHIECLEQLLVLARERDSLEDQLEALAQLGHAAVRAKDFEGAVRHHLDALDVLGNIRNAQGASRNAQTEREIRLSLGQAYRHLSRLEEAERSFSRALTLMEEAPDVEAGLRVQGNLALVQVDARHFDQAIETLEKVVAGYRTRGDYRLLAHATFNLGYAHHGKGDGEKALRYGQEALHLLERIHDPSAEEVHEQMEAWK